MPDTEIELANVQGPESRIVNLQLLADGGVRLHARDRGPLAELTFARSEYEFWVTVPPDAVARLAFELLRDKFTGRSRAVTEFRDYCKSREVVNTFDTRS